MKIKFLFCVLAVALLLNPIWGFACGMGDVSECCQSIFQAGVSNLEDKCCGHEESSLPSIAFTGAKQPTHYLDVQGTTLLLNHSSQHQVAYCSFSRRFQSAFSKIPPYISHAKLLL